MPRAECATAPLIPLTTYWYAHVESIRRAISRRSGLWENTDFLRFWIGETIANFGGQLGAIALPIIAAITLGASPFQMGLLAASTHFPRMIVGIFAGTWVDTRKRRPIMINVNLVRAATMMVIPITTLLGMLTFPVLLGVTIALGVLSILFDSAWNTMIPSMVDRDDLADANGKLWASMSLAQIAGPAVSGILIAIMTGPNVLTLNAIGWLVAAWCTAQVKRPEPEVTPQLFSGPREVLHNIRDGYRELIRNPIVRPLTTTMIGINFGSGIFGAVFVLFLTEELHLSTRGIGIMSAVGGLGALIGSVAAAPLARRFGYGRIITIGPFMQGSGNLTFAIAVYADDVGIALVAGGLLVGWIFLQAYDVCRFSLRQVATQPNLMGRVASSTMTLIAAIMMIGALVGGTIGEVWGLGPALALGALSQIAAGFLTLRSPIPAITTLPRQDTIEVIPVRGDLDPDPTDHIEQVVA